MVHPEHDCEDCGKTHFAWSLHKDWADKNRKTRNVLIVIAVISIALFPVSMTVFDLVKDPYSLWTHVELGKMVSGYDVACYSENGMQYCLLQSNDNNFVNYNLEKMVLQPKTNPCLNIYLETQDKITDRFMITNSSDLGCIGSLEFPVENGWSWQLEGSNVPVKALFVLEKSKQWWDTSNCPEENKFCNWWLDL